MTDLPDKIEGARQWLEEAVQDEFYEMMDDMIDRDFEWPPEDAQHDFEHEGKKYEVYLKAHIEEVK